MNSSVHGEDEDRNVLIIYLLSRNMAPSRPRYGWYIVSRAYGDKWGDLPPIQIPLISG